jgi:hypothetical protein
LLPRRLHRQASGQPIAVGRWSSSG